MSQPSAGHCHYSGLVKLLMDISLLRLIRESTVDYTTPSEKVLWRSYCMLSNIKMATSTLTNKVLDVAHSFDSVFQRRLETDSREAVTPI